MFLRLLFWLMNMSSLSNVNKTFESINGNGKDSARGLAVVSEGAEVLVP